MNRVGDLAKATSFETLVVGYLGLGVVFLYWSVFNEFEVDRGLFFEKLECLAAD